MGTTNIIVDENLILKLFQVQMNSLVYFWFDFKTV